MAPKTISFYGVALPPDTDAARVTKGQAMTREERLELRAVSRTAAWLSGIVPIDAPSQDAASQSPGPQPER